MTNLQKLQSLKKLNIEPTLELQIKVLEGLTGKAGVTPRQSLSDEKSVLSYLLAKTQQNLMHKKIELSKSIQKGFLG